MRARRGPSHKATDRRPSKKLKCEKRSLAKLQIRGADVCGSTSHDLFSKEPPDQLRSEAASPDGQTMLQSEGQVIPKAPQGVLGDQAGPCAEPLGPNADGCFPKADGEALFRPCVRSVEEEEEEEEGGEESCEAALSDDSEMEPEEVQGQVIELDNSVFLNEDSNQPLPVDRFFGSVAFMQDLPAAPLARATANRREFRKAHFIAKDDDEEEDEEVI
ncbi:UPF0688 protein C1orf174 homolog [Elgaria multicarinata webbii]|uniref:UPF0688 protein C1orf174 homolog n=1 Tax=Elgaria multicarinata webbii TaxID=159646 RepID=UPI002FCD2E40